jgi:hypothetical protein
MVSVTGRVMAGEIEEIGPGGAIDLILVIIRLVSMLGVTEAGHEITLTHFGSEGTDPGGDHDPLAENMRLTVAMHRGISVGTRVQEIAHVAEKAQQLDMLPGMNRIEHREYRVLPCRESPRGQVARALLTPPVVHDESDKLQKVSRLDMPLDMSRIEHQEFHKLQKVSQLDMPLDTNHIEHQEFPSQENSIDRAVRGPPNTWELHSENGHLNARLALRASDSV